MHRILKETPGKEEYIEFLKHSDLGSQYPGENFDERIEHLLSHANVSLVCRNEENRIIGVLLGLSDYAYWLFVTDLGADRDYERQGIGRQLMQEAHKMCGGESEIAVYLAANEKAIPFYEKFGMRKAEDVMEYNRIAWTPFRVV